jgi:hypothetical protein
MFSMAAAAAMAEEAKADRNDPDHEGNQADVDEFDARAKLLDVAVQVRLHFAQILAKADFLLAELFDFALLCIGQEELARCIPSPRAD